MLLYASLLLSLSVNKPVVQEEMWGCRSCGWMLPLLLVHCNQATFINFVVWPVWRMLGNGRGFVDGGVLGGIGQR